MSEPASIAPEPNNYEFISSGTVSLSFSFIHESSSSSSGPNRRIHSCLYRPPGARPAKAFFCSPLFFFASSSRFHRGERHVKGHRTWFSMFSLALSDCCVYLQRRFRSVSPASPLLIVCQSGPRKRKADSGSPPLPDGPRFGRRPKQKALSANRRAGNSSTL